LSEKFDSPVFLALGPSRLLAVLLASTHLGAALLAATVPLPIVGLVLLWLAIAASALDAVTRHVLRCHRDSVTAIALDGDGQHTLQFRGDGIERAFTLVSRYLDARLTLITARRAGHRRSIRIVIPSDAVDAARFRRWRAQVQLQTAAD
jgi:hypothetical protein